MCVAQYIVKPFTYEYVAMYVTTCMLSTYLPLSLVNKLVIVLL